MQISYCPFSDCPEVHGVGGQHLTFADLQPKPTKEKYKMFEITFAYIRMQESFSYKETVYIIYDWDSTPISGTIAAIGFSFWEVISRGVESELRARNVGSMDSGVIYDA